MNSKTMRVISAALLAYFVIMMATGIFGALADEGILIDAWFSVLEYIPFGNLLGPICIKLFMEAFEFGYDMSQYLIGIESMGILDFFEDICKLMLTSVFFEAFNNFLQVFLGVKERNGVHNVLMQMLCGMISAFLCTFIASLLLQFLCRQLESLPNVVQGVVSIFVSCITISGAIGVLYFVLGVGIVGTLILVFIKIIVINVLKVISTYIGTLLIILFLSEKAYLKMFTVFVGWGVVIVMLIGIDLMISSIFDN